MLYSNKETKKEKKEKEFRSRDSNPKGLVEWLRTKRPKCHTACYPIAPIRLPWRI